MMTTATSAAPSRRLDSAAGVLVATAGAAVVVGTSSVVLGLVLRGRAAGLGALVGSVVIVGVLAFGVGTVQVVSGLMPTASLMVALMTYSLQVLLLGLVLLALTRSGALGTSLDRHWVAGTIVAGTLCWTLAQVVATTRRRIPVYDLPAEPVTGTGERR